MKQFLQEGLRTYAPAALAIAEFNRQVRSRLQTALEERAEQFVQLGLDVSTLKEYGFDPNAEDAKDSTWFIGLKREPPQGASFYFYIEWVGTADEGKNLYVGSAIYVKRPDRGRLLEALKEAQLPDSTAKLKVEKGGAISLNAYFEAEEFYDLGETFRTLIQEWIGLLTDVGGVQQFIAPVLASESE